MVEPEHYRTQAHKCRALAGGLSNLEDIRKLEELAAEYEARASALSEALEFSADVPGPGNMRYSGH